MSSKDRVNFEEKLDRLERIVLQLEEDEPPLEDAIEAYEEGVELARTCLERLEAAELRIEELSLDDQ